METVSIEDVRAARGTIRPHLHRTPLWHSAALSEATGADLWLKAENLQKTGSFKPRGVVNAVMHLEPEELARGLITFSAGNTGQALAYAGRSAGAQATVVMPETAPRAKVDAIRGYGAEAVLVPPDRLVETMEAIQRERGQVSINPWGNPFLIAGHGTMGLEILEDLPDVEVVVVPVGGGGLLAGLLTAIKALRPEARVVGVEPELANVVALSLAAGEPVRILPTSIADGLNAPSSAQSALDIIRRSLDELIVIDEAAIARALALILQRTKLLVEPAGATAVAALLAGKVPRVAGRKTAAILSGGNIDLSRLAELVGGVG